MRSAFHALKNSGFKYKADLDRSGEPAAFRDRAGKALTAEELDLLLKDKAERGQLKLASNGSLNNLAHRLSGEQVAAGEDANGSLNDATRPATPENDTKRPKTPDRQPSDDLSGSLGEDYISPEKGKYNDHKPEKEPEKSKKKPNFEDFE